MTATSQLQPQAGSWIDTFPETQVTERQSAMFMKKLLAIAVSNITYMRVVFPEDAYSDRLLSGLNLKILKNDKSCPSAVQVVDWLKGVFDAIDKKYLRLLLLGFYRGSNSDPNSLLEMYTFRFSYTGTTEMEIYNNEQKISLVALAQETRKATLKLLHDLIAVIQPMRSLPADARVTMKLYYYDDMTPIDYEPPGFKAAETDYIYVEGNPVKYRFHQVNTAFHSLQLRVVVDPEEEAASEEENSDEEMKAILSGMDEEMQEDTVDSTTPETKPKVARYSQLDSADATTPAAAAAAAQEDEKEDAEEEEDQSYSDAELLGVRCACLINEDDGLMILCSVCHYWQHAVCFKILDQASVPARHVCNLCASSSSVHVPTDAEFTDVDQDEIQMMCLWRKTLALCLEVNHITPAQLACYLGVDCAVASRLTDRLVAEGFASAKKSRNPGTTRYAKKKKIRSEGLIKYF